MTRAAYTFRLALLVLWWNSLSFIQVQSLSSIPANSNFFPSPVLHQHEVVSTRQEIAFRIRTTLESDINDGISEMWANAVVESMRDDFRTSKSAFDFRRHMYYLKTKDCVEHLLRMRLRAIWLGTKTLEECSLHYDEEELSESEKLRYLWSSEKFRNCMEKAAKMSDEPHPWKSYNFACAPEYSNCLQHKMLTAEDRQTGEIIGFCEVAMLSEPSHDNETNEQNTDIRPTLVNLVVSPRHRRRGVASRIMKSAEVFVAKNWDAQDLNLFVDEDNDAAISLYQRLGFKHTSMIRRPEQDVVQWYMTLPLRSSVRESSTTRRPVLN